MSDEKSKATLLKEEIMMKGSKGAGRLEAEFITVDADSERIGDGELVMADGKRYPLDPK